MAEQQAAPNLVPDQVPDMGAIKQRQQAMWSSGNYAVVGAALQWVGENLCEAMDIRSGWQVLDVAAGNGNVSLAAARRGCVVTSTDYVPALLEAGRRRAEAEGWRIQFQEADAENLPFGDGTFDAAVSTVGVMFAPNQERAAAEMMRVVKPGGRIGLACWTPEGFVGQTFRTIARYVPPPAGVKPAVLWGTAARLQELFPAASAMKIEARLYMMRSLSAERWLEVFKTYFGPMIAAMAALDEAGREALSGELIALAESVNRAEDGTLVAPSEYLEIVITK